jgi:hypothetical protein
MYMIIEVIGLSPSQFTNLSSPFHNHHKVQANAKAMRERPRHGKPINQLAATIQRDVM